MERPRADEPRVFGLNGVITGIEDLLTRLTGENIVLNRSLAEDLGAVRMDPSQLQQILLNLVLNARDAMPGSGQITDPETLERAFEPDHVHRGAELLG